MEQDKDIFVTRMTELYRISGCPSVTQFAKQIGLKRQTVDKYLNGIQKADMPSIKQICTAMNITSDWLLGLSDIMTPSADIQSAVAALGITEAAAQRIIDPAVCGSKKDALSHLIESEDFGKFINLYKVFLDLLNRLNEKDLDHLAEIVTDDAGNIVLSTNEAINHFKRRVSHEMEMICDSDHLERLSKLEYTPKIKDRDSLIMEIRSTENEISDLQKHLQFLKEEVLPEF